MVAAWVRSLAGTLDSWLQASPTLSKSQHRVLQPAVDEARSALGCPPPALAPSQYTRYRQNPAVHECLHQVGSCFSLHLLPRVLRVSAGEVKTLTNQLLIHYVFPSLRALGKVGEAAHVPANPMNELTMAHAENALVLLEVLASLHPAALSVLRTHLWEIFVDGPLPQWSGALEARLQQLLFHAYLVCMNEYAEERYLLDTGSRALQVSGSLFISKDHDLSLRVAWVRKLAMLLLTAHLDIVTLAVPQLQVLFGRLLRVHSAFMKPVLLCMRVLFLRSPSVKQEVLWPLVVRVLCHGSPAPLDSSTSLLLVWHERCKLLYFLLHLEDGAFRG
jgi:hypothetical protein